MVAMEEQNKMQYKDWITMNETAIEKFKDNPDFKDKVEVMIEQTRRLKLLSPERLKERLPNKEAMRIIRLFKTLGITCVELTPEVSLISEMNRIANEVLNE